MTEVFVFLAVACLLLFQWGSCGLALRRYLEPRALPEAEQPFITLLRPVCGLDAHDAETLASSFSQDYPDYEIIFCAAFRNDPAVPVVRRLIAAHPHVKARLLIGDSRASGNPKLNNLIKGWDAARADWIVMSDCNVMLPRDFLATLAACWTPGTGLVSSPPIGERAEGFWGAVEVAFLNGNQARLQLAADSCGMGYAQGKTLFWKRDLLDQAGGPAVLGRELAEDVASTKLVRTAGLKVRLTPRPFPQPIGRRTAQAIWGRQLRWARVRWQGFPHIFLMEPLNGPAVPFALVGASALTGGIPALAAAAFPLLWYLPEFLLARAAGWPTRPRDFVAWALRDMMIPALWVATFARPGFEWRGTQMSPADIPEAGHENAARA